MAEDRLVAFIQGQFARLNLWCWETVFEEVIQRRGLLSRPDQLTYAGARMRTGEFAFRQNDAEWRALSARVAESPAEAMRVLREVERALTDREAVGFADAWLEEARSASTGLAPGDRAFFDRLLEWRGQVYRGPGIFDAGLGATSSVLYALYRIGDDERPTMPLPLNVGETGATVVARIRRNHANWWGRGRSFGAVIEGIAHDGRERRRVERLLQDAMLPFCNSDGPRLDQLRARWQTVIGRRRSLAR